MSGLELKGLKGLKGLDDLLRDSHQYKPVQEGYALLPLSSLVSGKYQPRTVFEEPALLELADSIRAQGIIQPLIVRKINLEHYEIIAGERRARAAHIAGLVEVPTIIRNVTDDTAFAFALIENIQRKDLNPIEEAAALQRLIGEFAMTHDQVATAIGRSRSMVTNMLRLLHLAPPVKELLKLQQLEVGHAKVLLVLPEDKQIMAAEWVVAKNMTVRETEVLVKKLLVGEDELLSIAPPRPFDPRLLQWEDRITRLVTNKVALKMVNENNIKLTLSFSSAELFEQFIEQFENAKPPAPLSE